MLQPVSHFATTGTTTQLQPASTFATSDIQKVASVQCHRGKLQPSTENATTFDEKSFNRTRDEFFTQALLKTKKVSIVYRKASTIEGKSFNHWDKSYNRVNFLLLQSVFLLHPFMRPWCFFTTEVWPATTRTAFLLQHPRFLLPLALCFATSD